MNPFDLDKFNKVQLIENEEIYIAECLSILHNLIPASQVFYVHKTENEYFFVENNASIQNLKFDKLDLLNLNQIKIIENKDIILPIHFGFFLIQTAYNLKNIETEKLNLLTIAISIKQKDIRDKASYENLIKSQGQWIDIINHDLKTPLTTIAGYLYFLTKDPTKNQFIESLNQEKTKLVSILERNNKLYLLSELYTRYYPSLINNHDVLALLGLDIEPSVDSYRILVDPTKIKVIFNLLFIDLIPMPDIIVSDKTISYNFIITKLEEGTLLYQLFNNINKEWVKIIKDIASINKFEINVDIRNSKIEFKFPIFYSFI